jgi:hypothetical protein
MRLKHVSTFAMLLAAAAAPAFAEDKASPISITADEPKLKKPVEDLDYRYWEVVLRIKNQSNNEIVLSPFVYVKVQNSARREVRPDAFIGAGFAGHELMDEIEKRFIVVPAGKTGEIAVNLANNDMGNYMNGWHFKTPGDYMIQLRCKFNRKEFADTFFKAPFAVEDKELQNLKRADRKWNQALEIDKTLSVVLKIGR